jgi:serine/threonine protein kinase/tetratricopeptide (TPR) repeat protein
MPDLPKPTEDSSSGPASPPSNPTFETQVPDSFSTLPTKSPTSKPSPSSVPEPVPAVSERPSSAKTTPTRPTPPVNQDLEFNTQAPFTVATPPLQARSPAANAKQPNSVGPTLNEEPTERKPGVLPDQTELPVDLHADYATVAPNLPAFSPLDPPTDLFGSRATRHSQSPFGPDFPQPAAERFRILREHAKGGFGKVFVAEDLELGREVAFKEIQHKYADDHETQVRFLREARITGGLEHPGIVPIYGLGVHENGRPYYAMRFIRGESLQQAIRAYHDADPVTHITADGQLEFRRLLRRFIDVCNALEYAHAQGIVHRDLKPGNIMLGEYGETLVVDWGLAKSFVEPDTESEQCLSASAGAVSDASMSATTPRSRLARLSDDGSLQTMIGASVGTPQFMSPEQARGLEDEVGSLSDIYSLGATLYCILTGAGAFTGKSPDEVIQQVIKGKFPAPKVTNPEAPTPLSAICLKAMARFPAERYPSANALAGDIEHWLADEPIEAYQETRRELFSRWVRKHQARAQAIGLAIIAIAVVSIVAAVLIDQSRRSEATARAKLKIANDAEILAKHEALRRTRQTREAIDTSLSGMSDALETFPGMQDTRRRLLVQAATDYAKLAQEKSLDPELQSEAARNLVRLGDVRIKLNDLALATTEYQKAAEIFQLLSQQHPDAPEYLLELALTYIQQGVALAIQDQHSSADSQFREAAALLTPLVQEHPDQLEYQDGLATALIGSGRAKNASGDPTGAEELLNSGLKIFAQLRREHPENMRIAGAYTESISAMSRFLLDRGRANDAVKLLEDSLEIHDKIIAEHPDLHPFHANRATARINLAEAQRSLGRWPSVARNYESALDDYQDLVHEQPDVPLYRENLAVARTNFGQALRRMGDNLKAVPVLEKALENFNELGASFPLPRYVEAAGNTRVSLSLAVSDLGKQAEALKLIEAALADYAELLDLDPKSVPYQENSAMALGNEARIAARQGDFSGALPKFETAIKALQAAADQQPETPRYQDHLAFAWTHLANAAHLANQSERAKSAFQSAIEVRKKLQSTHATSAQYQDALAWLLATCPLAELRDQQLALKLAVGATESIPESPQFQLTLAAAQYQHQKPDDALQSLKISRRLRGQDDGFSLYLQALCESQLKQRDNAKATLIAARAWRTLHKPADEELTHWDKLVEHVVDGQSK